MKRLFFATFFENLDIDSVCVPVAKLISIMYVDSIHYLFILFGRWFVFIHIYSTLFTQDFDVAPEGETIEESHNNLDVITDYLLEKQKETNINLLWATQNLFSNPRYMNGGMTNPDVQVSIYIIIFKIESEIEGSF